MSEKVISGQVLKGTSVDNVTLHETIKLKAAIGVAIGALVISAVVLGVGLYTNNNSLQSWATGLISSIAGAAIGYGFNGRVEK